MKYGKQKHINNESIESIMNKVTLYHYKDPDIKITIETHFNG